MQTERHMYVHLCVNGYYMHLCTVYVRMYMYAHTYAYTYVWMHICMYVRINAYVRMYISKAMRNIQCRLDTYTLQMCLSYHSNDNTGDQYNHFDHSDSHQVIVEWMHRNEITINSSLRMILQYSGIAHLITSDDDESVGLRNAWFYYQSNG